ncbi:MAG: 3-phosphoshikimate 1-carboxyvinyltransferase, partial [Clostridiales bacterium]|nr:3-phosphoshikimate 1-carboxyvinyltransferase [Clostridiales bacterium]
MQKEIRIPPIKKFTKTLACVPDKSITHRALMFNAAAKGTGEVRGMLLGEDCLSTLDCMRRMGAQIELQGDCARIAGAGKLRSADLDCGNSGTTMRLLCGLLAAQEGETFTLSGDESLSRRPMRRVIDPLASMGARIASQEGKAPLTVSGKRLHGINYEMPVASAQVKSAILLAALGAEGVTRVTEKEATRDHTEIMLRHMGVNAVREGNTVTIAGGQTLHAAPITVAGDISSAAFPLVCGLVTGGEVSITNVGLNPTRTGLIEVFDRIGADYEIADEKMCGGEKTGTVTVRGLGAARPFRIDKPMIPRLVDEIPVLAVLACFLGGDSEICGAEELRVKESDRIAATVRLIRAFGGKAEETAGGFTVAGTGRLTGGCAF